MDEKAQNILIKEITKKIEESMYKTINSAIDRAVEKIRNEIISILKPQLEEINQKVDSAIKRVDIVERRIDDVVENNKRICNLRLNEFPFYNDENLQSVMKNLSSALGYESPPDHKIYRLGKNKNSTIIIKFATEFHKNEFHERFLRVPKSITVNVLNGKINSNERCYLSQDLTKKQYELNKSAISLLKTGKIHRVAIVNGNVAVKISPSEPYQLFESISPANEAKSLKTTQTKGAPKQPVNTRSTKKLNTL
ncbi:CLUMA_CG007239, isoform A [Clunio marinus]|uniref:CLUMA_CG007239, isoform A n=1 Tax=Clunio marinus TaxID=568069 RepID=A0A1J1I031_9DIPT|nr:CLUMA_CG007239, isoform A [Clunio marinus]